MNNPIKFNRYRLSAVCIILAITLAACGQGKLPTPTQTLTSTGSTTASTPAPVRTILFTYTPQPSDTPIPAEKTPLLTLVTVMTMTPFSYNCESSNFWGSSPDGQWSFKSCSRETFGYQDYLQVLNNYDGRLWRIGFDRGTSGKYGMLDPVRWTEDGLDLYLSELTSVEGPMLDFFDDSGLLRFNLVTGETKEILPIGYYAFAFSVSDRLAYIYRGYQPPQFLNILDLSTGQEQRFSLGSTYCGIGHLMWSPQEDRIIYTAATCAQYPYIASMYSFMIIDLNTGDYHSFYSSANVLPYPLKWEHDYPMFSSVGYSATDQPACWVLNLDVGGLLPAECP